MPVSANRLAICWILRLCKDFYIHFHGEVLRVQINECSMHTELHLLNINQKMKFRKHGAFVEINPQDLPMEMDVEIFLDLGENSNANTLQKLQQLGSQVLPKTPSDMLDTLL